MTESQYQGMAERRDPDTETAIRAELGDDISMRRLSGRQGRTRCVSALWKVTMPPDVVGWAR
jgi:hypothetical protein